MFLILVFLTLVSSSIVFDLDESNFERQTKASSGQTKGKWFVLFSATAISSSQADNDNDALQSLASTIADNNIHIGRVDILQNPKLRQRFGIRYYPTHLFFANNQMFIYRGPTSVDKGAVQAMTNFLEKRYATLEGLMVPPPFTKVDEWMEQIFALVENFRRSYSVLREDMDHITRYRKNAAFVLMCIGGFIGALLVLLLRLVFSNTKSKNPKSKKQD